MKSAYDLDREELVSAEREASEFAQTVHPWNIENGHGPYREKRPGLGIVVHEYTAIPGLRESEWRINFSVVAYRVNGEERFGQYAAKQKHAISLDGNNLKGAVIGQIDAQRNYIPAEGEISQ